MLKTSLVVVRTGLWRDQDGSRKTNQEAKGRGRRMDMARMLPMEVVRGGWIPGVPWMWEVRKREESRMIPQALGGWMVTFREARESGGEAVAQRGLQSSILNK